MNFLKDIKTVCSAENFPEIKKKISDRVISCVQGDVVEMRALVNDLIKLPISITEFLFWEKFSLFINHTYFESEDELRKLSTKIADNENSEEYAKRILKILDDADTKEKVIIISNLTRAILSGFITYEEYFRICNSVVNSLYEDLMYIKNNINRSILNHNINVEFLKQNGLVKQTVRAGTIFIKEVDDDEEYCFTDLAKKLFEYGINYGLE